MKVRCEYCSKLNHATSLECYSCGAEIPNAHPQKKDMIAKFRQLQSLATIEEYEAQQRLRLKEEYIQEVLGEGKAILDETKKKKIHFASTMGGVQPFEVVSDEKDSELSYDNIAFIIFVFFIAGIIATGIMWSEIEALIEYLGVI